MPRYVDLSHPIEDGMPTYPGLLPPVRVEALMDHAASRDRYQGKAEFFLGKVELPFNTGTYLDAPFHRFPDAPDLAGLPVDALAGLPGVCVDAAGDTGGLDIDAPDEDLADRAVLLRTGWSRRWGTDAYWEPDPWLSAAAVDRLVATRARLVGVDFRNVDDTNDLARPAHTALLEAGILIVEGLRRLQELPPSGFRFFAVPPAIVRGAAFPVRAFAELPD